MSILVIGGAGFIGSHLVDYYLDKNEKVIVIDNLSSGSVANIESHHSSPNFKFYHADVLKCSNLEDILKDCEIVYNMAAIVGMFNVLEKPIQTLHVNINITENLLSIIAQLDRKPLVVIASSSEVYGSKRAAMNESDALITAATDRAHASYLISKLCNETTGIAYYKEKKIPVIILRIFNTVGPRQSSRYGMVVPRFIKQALSNEPLTVFSDGLQTRCFCDVRDLSRMLDQLTLTEKSWGQIVNVGSEKAISILDLAKLVINITQSKSKLIFQSYEKVYGEDYIDIQNRKPDLKKLRRIIDYSPRWTLETTIKSIMDSISSRNKDKEL